MRTIPTVSKSSTSSTKPRQDRTELGKLYPKPKTYDQQRTDRQAREQRRLMRMPRHVAFSTATRLFILISLGAFFLSAAPVILFYNVLTGAFWVVALALIILGVIKWQGGEASTALYSLGLNDSGFLTLYALTIAPIGIVALYILNTHINGALLVILYIGIFILNYVIIRALIRYLIKQQ
ncbi:MAG: hypothetical protein JWM07_590 [Candidatus Saccharibacteria bacterium]|nr:hypothetical protein [Candidatus Saccharibacteria bacterium]